MKTITRRSFLKTTSAQIGAGLVLGATSSTWARPLGANDDVRFAVIGFNGKGAQHIDLLLALKGVRIAALCDLDPAILARGVEKLKAQKINVFATTDAREIMARPDIDAVLIATSTHWHALLTVWACQAGKDVYVEKPVAHTIWEGRKMIEAAAKYGRIVQAGTQIRSDQAIAEVIDYVRSGHLGKIRWIHGVYNRLRDDIGSRLPWYPDSLNYDMFCGPTPVVPLVRNHLHYDWHWMWATGNGDLSNLGIHVLDIARRFAGDELQPRRILSLGGRFAHKDTAETPNTQFALYDYPHFPITFETRGLPAKAGVQFMDNFRGVRRSVVVQCEEGYVTGYGGGGIAYDKNGKEIRKFQGDSSGQHIHNLVAAMRSRRPQDLTARIETGHASTSICHFANISYRIGRPARLGDVLASLDGFPTAQERARSLHEHLRANQIDLDRHPLTLGQWIKPDGDAITSVESGNEASLALARFLVKETQRAPYAIPELV